MDALKPMFLVVCKNTDTKQIIHIDEHIYRSEHQAAEMARSRNNYLERMQLKAIRYVVQKMNVL